LEQLPFDVCDDLRARNTVELLAQYDVVRVEVAEVVRRHRPELVEHAPRQADVSCDLVAELSEKLRQNVGSVDVHGAHPRQVVQADLVDDDSTGLQPEALGKG